MNHTRKSFANLGIDPVAIKRLPPSRQLEAVLYNLTGIVDQIERTAMAQQIFGKSGLDLVGTLEVYGRLSKADALKYQERLTAAIAKAA